ncbi:MAG: thiamine biosynthesis protein ApbE [Gammaproteobacteria bacterium]|nr:MAG: thiamine biosynthesis protein ApbE [Gammaproteobacteria bacterium]
MRIFTVMLSIVAFLLACQPTPEVQIITGHAQGTTYSVKYWTDAESPDKHALKQTIDSELARIDSLMSNYRDDSAIEQFNQQQVVNQPIPLDKEILALLDVSAAVYQASQHCYDPTIKPLFNIWGFSKNQLNIPNRQQIQQALTAIGFDKLQRHANGISKTNPKQTIDLSAIGQGYAVQQIANLLEKEGISDYLVEIGGEMLVAGSKPASQQWRVGVERPLPDSQAVSEVITLTGKRPTAIMTSGTYRHYFDDHGKRYSHILDPRSGKPIEHNSVAVTVLLDDATQADAWSTALLCLGSEDGLQVANENAIPAVFYDMEDGEITRRESDGVKQSDAYWRIER